jgi:hypothetical protein
MKYQLISALIDGDVIIEASNARIAINCWLRKNSEPTPTSAMIMVGLVPTTQIIDVYPVVSAILECGKIVYGLTTHGWTFKATQLELVQMDRDQFEEAVFADYFVRGIKRNSNPPKGTGALDFIPTNNKTKKELLERSQDGNYKDESISAMWHGWQLAIKHR